MNNLQSPITAVIFDADDTLWECAQHYKDTRNQFIDSETKRTDLDREFVASVFYFFDAKLLQLPGGFERDRFPRAFYVTSLALDGIIGVAPNIDAADRAYELGDSVYDQEFALYPGVKDMLEKMRAEYPGMLMIAQTKGPLDVQRGKFEKNGIDYLFDKIYVRSVKGEKEFRDILDTYHLLPEEVLCVGDSMKDDVIAPRNIECRVVWISKTRFEDWKPSWVYEEGTTPEEPDWQIYSVAELLDIDIPFMQVSPSRV